MCFFEIREVIVVFNKNSILFNIRSNFMKLVILVFIYFKLGIGESVCENSIEF